MLTRRLFLRGGGTTLSVTVAGCLGGSSPRRDDSVTSVVTTFFAFYDLARHVACDRATVESLVPLSEQSHGWEPTADVQRTATNATVFVYVGPDVQGWADDVVTNLRTDNPDVVIVNASQGIDLLPATETDSTTSETDPHFWLDPTKFSTAVRTVQHGMEEADPDNAGVYRECADEYVDRLDELDRTIVNALDTRRKDLVVVAGHNAYRYLADRYEFDVFSPIGVSPDASPSPRAIQRVQEVVGDNDLDYILTPALESDRLARELAAETDVEVLPITPVAGQTDEWMEADWGYLEQMESVNLASLRTALEAT